MNAAPSAIHEWGLKYLEAFLVRSGLSIDDEFYKKRCQEKSSAATGGSRLFLEIQPTLYRYL
jgi:hypothetical protein